MVYDLGSGRTLFKVINSYFVLIRKNVTHFHNCLQDNTLNTLQVHNVHYLSLIW